MSAISASTLVFPYFLDPQTGQRIWLTSAETRTTRDDRKILFPLMDDDQAAAKSFRYDLALIMQRRFREEGLGPQYDLHFALNPTGEEVARSGVTSAPTADNRQVMTYKGLLVRPYIPHGWCVHLFDGPRQLESVKGETIEGAVDKVYERNLQTKAEKAPAPPAPEPPELEVARGPRLRPGDIQ